MIFDMGKLVNRFLAWPVPADVHPDGVAGQVGRSGTNLMNADQARKMLTHVLSNVDQGRVLELEEEVVRLRAVANAAISFLSEKAEK